MLRPCRPGVDVSGFVPPGGGHYSCVACRPSTRSHLGDKMRLVPGRTDLRGASCCLGPSLWAGLVPGRACVRGRCKGCAGMGWGALVGCLVTLFSRFSPQILDGLTLIFPQKKQNSQGDSRARAATSSWSGRPVLSFQAQFPLLAVRVGFSLSASGGRFTVLVSPQTSVFAPLGILGPWESLGPWTFFARVSNHAPHLLPILSHLAPGIHPSPQSLKS